jgi:hypothetical protein
MVLDTVIVEVRQMLQDTNANVALQRYSDAQLLGFANQALKRIAVLRPDLFAKVAEFTTTAGEVLQTAPSDSIRIMEVFRVKDGAAVRETNRLTLDQTYPDWANDDPGTCVNWMRHVRNNNRFFIYPKAPSSQVLIIEYSQAPKNYVAGETVALLPDAYFPVVVDGTIFLAESIDNEHVNSNRAQLFQQSFMQALSTNFQARSVTDTEEAGLPTSQVV